jgi:hypothetical protein
MTVAIPLFKNGKPTDSVALIDNADLRRVLRVRRWSVLVPRGSLTKYVRGHFQGREVFLHRFIMHEELQLVEGVVEVDHGLNNCRANLRIIPHAENIRAAWRLPGRFDQPRKRIWKNIIRSRLKDGTVRMYVYDRPAQSKLASER